MLKFTASWRFCLVALQNDMPISTKYTNGAEKLQSEEELVQKLSTASLHLVVVWILELSPTILVGFARASFRLK